MDIIKEARNLGVMIQNTEEFKEFKAAKEKADNDANLNEKIGKLNLIKLELDNVLNRNLDDSVKKLKNQELLKVYNEINENENMKRFKRANEKLNELVSKIVTVIYNCAGGLDPKTCPETSRCGGDCNSCGGCG